MRTSRPPPTSWVNASPVRARSTAGVTGVGSPSTEPSGKITLRRPSAPASVLPIANSMAPLSSLAIASTGANDWASRSAAVSARFWATRSSRSASGMRNANATSDVVAAATMTI